MATIKFRRGSGQPAGLTAYEPAWDTTNNRLFVNNGSTAMWVGAQVVQDTTLAGNCAFFIPTQNAVKTYVDNQVTSGLCAGAVASVNGVTGAVVISGSTGISVLASTSLRGITVSVNSDVALRNASNTFSGLQTFSNGITAGGTSTLVDLILKDNLDVGGTAWFTQDVRFSGVLANEGSGITIGDKLKVTGTTELVGDLTTKSSIFAQGRGNFQAGISASGGFTLSGNGYIENALTVDGLLTLGSGLNAKGATFANIYASNVVSSVDGVTGAVDLLAGSGISITNPTGTAKGITLANTGVVGITGTANQVAVSATTGSVTLSLPSAVTMPGSLTVTGDLTVNGTTTTVNSTTVTVQDPLIAIGGVTANAPPPAGDTKDRGIVFQWGDGTSGRTGFFGFDRSTGRFTFLPLGVSVSGEVVTGTAGNAELAGVYAPQGLLTLAGVSGSENATATITLNGGTGTTTRSINHSAYRHVFNNGADAANPPAISLLGAAGSASTNIFSGADTTDKVFTLPNMTGTAVVADAMGATSGWVLRGTGALTTPTWINPAASGFTAFGAERSVLQLISPVKNSSSYPVLFGGSTSGYQSVHADSLNDINWNPGTVTLTIGSGNGKLEGVVDGGAF